MNAEPALPARDLLLAAALLGDDIAGCTCVAGTLAQEVWDSHPAVRAACGAAIGNHAATLEADIAAARPDGAEWTAASLALFTQTVLQGAFVVAKAMGASTWRAGRWRTCAGIWNWS
jgi:hypothetical protein